MKKKKNQSKVNLLFLALFLLILSVLLFVFLKGDFSLSPERPKEQVIEVSLPIAR